MPGAAQPDRGAIRFAEHVGSWQSGPHCLAGPLPVSSRREDAGPALKKAAIDGTPRTSLARRTMSKTESIAALRTAATQVFSEVGYYGASLREIATAAGVPLSTIHTYFGSKVDLFADVVGEAWREIEKDRTRILAERTNGNVATLSDIVHAVAHPIVVRARSPEPAQFRIPRLLRHWVVAPQEVSVQLRKLHGTEATLRRWIETLMAACPSLSTADAMWGFSFLVGAVYSWELTDKRYDTVLGFSDQRGPEELTDQLVNFVVSGLQDMAQRRIAAAGT